MPRSKPRTPGSRRRRTTERVRFRDEPPPLGCYNAVTSLGPRHHGRTRPGEPRGRSFSESSISKYRKSLCFVQLVGSGCPAQTKEKDQIANGRGCFWQRQPSAMYREPYQAMGTRSSGSRAHRTVDQRRSSAATTVDRGTALPHRLIRASDLERQRGWTDTPSRPCSARRRAVAQPARLARADALVPRGPRAGCRDHDRLPAPRRAPQPTPRLAPHAADPLMVARRGRAPRVARRPTPHRALHTPRQPRVRRRRRPPPMPATAPAGMRWEVLRLF